MKKIEIGDIVSRAWDLAVKHWPVFVLIAFIEECFSGIGVNYDSTALSGLGQNPDPQLILETMRESLTVSPWLIVGLLVSLYLGFITYRMLRNAIVNGKPYETVGDALKIDITQFAVFFAVEVCYGLAVCIGSFFCLIPGLFILVRWMFAPLIVATENVSFTEAFSRSWNLTKGHFWSLFLLGIVAVGIVILGLCACCVGVFFAEVIINFMMMLAYLDLKGDDAPQVTAETTETADFVEIQ